MTVEKVYLATGVDWSTVEVRRSTRHSRARYELTINDGVLSEDQARELALVLQGWEITKMRTT